MIIDEKTCSGCGECIKFCPVSAISIKKKRATIEQALCTECGNCLKVNVCQEKAIVQNKSSWPRTIRNSFSDPHTVFENTGLAGRGTEEMKTNDVTKKFRKGEVGFTIDLGRPNGTGVRLRDVEKITKAVARLGVQFEKDSPITFLIEDPSLGTLKPDVLDEFVVTAIVEFKVKLEDSLRAFQVLKDVGSTLDAVFSVGVISTVDEYGIIPVKDLFEGEGIEVAPHGKTNIGLGRG